MTRAVIADASKITPAAFLRAILAEPDDSIAALVGQLWGATPEKRAEINAKLAEYRKEKGIKLPADALTDKVETPPELLPENRERWVA